MPNRIFKDSSKWSKTLDKLSDGAYRMFVSLVLSADDYGRFRAEPEALKAICFPMRIERLKLEKVSRWYSEMESADLVRTYQVGEHLYGYFPTFEKHNGKPRAQVSKFPYPPFIENKGDSICTQMIANAPVFRSPVSDVRIPKSDTTLSSTEDQPSSNGSSPEWGTPEALIELYNAEGAAELPAVEAMTPGRIRKAKEYLKMFPERQFWLEVFHETKQSAFLRGLRPTKGHTNFRGDFDWLLTKGKDGTENCAKVHEGHYADVR